MYWTLLSQAVSRHSNTGPLHLWSLNRCALASIAERTAPSHADAHWPLEVGHVARQAIDQQTHRHCGFNLRALLPLSASSCATAPDLEMPKRLHINYEGCICKQLGHVPFLHMLMFTRQCAMTTKIRSQTHMGQEQLARVENAQDRSEIRRPSHC